jgi:hypothetical protein
MWANPSHVGQSESCGPIRVMWANPSHVGQSESCGPIRVMRANPSHLEFRIHLIRAAGAAFARRPGRHGPARRMDARHMAPWISGGAGGALAGAVGQALAARPLPVFPLPPHRGDGRPRPGVAQPRGHAAPPTLVRGILQARRGTCTVAEGPGPTGKHDGSRTLAHSWWF